MEVLSSAPIVQNTPDMVAEANHRVANSLTLLGGLVRMQARAVGKAAQTLTNAEVRLMLDGVAARIATIGQLHRMLAILPAEGAIPLNAHVREVCKTLRSAFSSEQQQVVIDHHGAECIALARHVQPLTLILCEIVTNAMKYAHPAGMPVHIRVECESSADGMLTMSVSDDGVGLPDGFDPLTGGGLGFQVVRALTAEIGGELKILSDNLGVTFRLTVPGALVANSKSA